MMIKFGRNEEMVFSSLTFLFFFLPIVLISYYSFFPFGNRCKNYILILASLIFYAWGDARFVFLMIFSIIANYFFGLQVDAHSKANRKLWLVLSILFNLSILIIFKYSGFLFGMKNIPLPLGISFYTFQVMSYIIDVYRKDSKAQKKVTNLALYISLFPKLTAGPIVRYQMFDNQINSREHSWVKFAEGVNRLVFGLAKKVILADQLAEVANGMFMKDVAAISVLGSWIGAICFALQIYFDFSGYSDMAIGLGKMFGFDFSENFNYPYISQSVAEFWRRWHITLGSWFRDYVYIPLGGNRVTKIKYLRNLFVVWLLTGLWHGAAWNFIIWGLYYGLFISLEKLFLEKLLKRLPKMIRHIYLILIVLVGWVFFRADNIMEGVNYIGVMMGFGSDPIINNDVLLYLKDYWYVILASAIFSTPVGKLFHNIFDRINKKSEKLSRFMQNGLSYAFQSLVLVSFMLMVIVLLVRSSYNPFLYFKF